MYFNFCFWKKLLGISLRITNSAIGLNIYPITAQIKKYKKKEKMDDKIVLLEKSKLNSIAVLISKAFINPNFSHDWLILINNVLKEYKDMKEEIKNKCKQFIKDFSLFIRQCYLIVSKKTNQLKKIQLLYK